MDPPPIRYARTSDGVDLACWTLGAGPPLVIGPPMPFISLPAEWSLPEVRSWYERLAQDYLVVRFEVRGIGLSSAADFDY